MNIFNMKYSFVKCSLVLVWVLFYGCGNTSDINATVNNTSNIIDTNATINEKIDKTHVELKNEQNSTSDTHITINNTSNTIDTNDTASVHSNVEVNLSVVDMINNLRVKSGMTTLSINSLLTLSAQNHADYLASNNLNGHYESGADRNFTGEKPVDRTKYVAYPNTKVSENVSTGQSSWESSLDGLMGAIYHRFGFLSFDIDEIGAARTDKSYVYNMGNSQLSALCEGKSFEGEGKYYYSVCLDKDFKIESKLYDNTLAQTKSQNPPYVIYPYANEEDVTPSFYEESPDPLPDYGVSGYPISVEFNANDFNMSKFTFIDFTLRDRNNQSVELISYNDNTNVLRQANDVNKELSKYQFVIFPQNRLEYDNNYSASFSYVYDGQSNVINWSFRTKQLDNLLVYDGTPLQLALNKKYYIYIPPQDNKDVINTFSTNCRYTQGGSLDINKSLYDGNTLSMKISGSLIKSCLLQLSNGREISINIE